jgi:hypothetical protein
MTSNIGLPEILIILGVCLCVLVIIATIIVVIVVFGKKNRQKRGSDQPNKEDL